MQLICICRRKLLGISLILVWLAIACQDAPSDNTNPRPDSINTTPTTPVGEDAGDESMKTGSISKTLYILYLEEDSFRILRDASPGNSSRIVLQYFVKPNSDTLTLKAWSGRTNDDSFENNTVLLKPLLASSLDLSNQPFNLPIQKLTRTVINRITLTENRNDELLIFRPYPSSDGIRYEVQVIQSQDRDNVGKDVPSGVISVTTNPAPPGIFNIRTNDVP